MRRGLVIMLAILAAPFMARVADAGEATVVTRAAMDLRVGQIRGIAANLAAVDGTNLQDAGAQLEGVAQVRAGSTVGSATVTVVWNALRFGDRRELLPAPPLSTFDLLTSALPGATPIAVRGDTAAVRAALERLGATVPAPAAASSTPLDGSSPGSAGYPPAGRPGSSGGTSTTSLPAPLASSPADAGAQPPAGAPAAVQQRTADRTSRPTPSYGEAVHSTSSGSSEPASGSRILRRSPGTAERRASQVTPPTVARSPSTSSTSDQAVAATPASTTPTTAQTGSAPDGSAGSGSPDPVGSAAPGGNATVEVPTAGSTASGNLQTDATVPQPGSPVESAGIVCEPQVDLATRTVVDRYRRYRIAPDGAPTWIDEGCLRNETTMRPLGATTEGCAPLVDPDGLVAIELRRRTYGHPAGGNAYAGPCLELEDARRFAITYTPIGCRLQHEWDDRRTVGLVRPVFTIDGAEFPAGGCADRDGSPAIFPHQSQACADLVVVIQGIVRTVKQQRTLIETLPPREIVPCQPVASDTVLATGPGGALHIPANADNDGRDLVVDGCDRAYVHDVDARMSFATRRWYFRTEGGLEIGTALHALTGCVLNPQESYDHVYVYTGWRNDDDERVAWHQVAVRVALPGHGEVTIASGVEPDGPQAYSSLGRQIEMTGQRFLVGCDQYDGRRWIESLERPDGTTLAVEGGTAAPALAGSCRTGRVSG